MVAPCSATTKTSSKDEEEGDKASLKWSIVNISLRMIDVSHDFGILIVFQLNGYI